MQVFVNGIISGLIIAVMALAFTVVYLPTRVFHVALGAVYALAPFVVWACLKAAWSWQLSVVLAVLVSVILSLACELVNHGPLERKRASATAHLVSSLGIYILVVGAVALTWGNDPKILRVGLDSVFRIGDLVLTGSQLTASAILLFLLAGFYLWLRLSNLGLQFRGLADNPVEMALCGYDINRLRLVSFALSGFLGSAAGLTVSLDLGFDPHGGLHTLMLAVVAMIVGGRHSFVGPVVAGILLGIIRSEVVWLMSARWQEAVTFLLLAAFLLFRPGGIFSRKMRLEAEN